MFQKSQQTKRSFAAALGWLEFGNYVEAFNELENLPPEQRAHPDVLDLRCRIYGEAGKWEDVCMIARGAANHYPNKLCFYSWWARAEKEQGRTERAIEILLGASAQFPKTVAVAYGLACFYDALGRIPEAAKWLSCAFEWSDNQNKLKLRALDQPELLSLWSEGGFDGNEIKSQ